MWKMTVLDKVVQVLLIVGGLNWGLVGIKSSYNLVDKLFGVGSTLSRVVYYVVGLAAVYALYKAVTMMSEKSE